MASIQFNPYDSEHFDACLALFDANCPAYFAPNERDEYAEFLAADPSGYEICTVDNSLCGAFGISMDGTREARLHWILLDPDVQGAGIGSAIMRRVLAASRAAGAQALGIATSQFASAFFAKHGASTNAVTADGFGPGMDRVDMVIAL